MSVENEEDAQSVATTARTAGADTILDLLPDSDTVSL